MKYLKSILAICSVALVSQGCQSPQPTGSDPGSVTEVNDGEPIFPRGQKGSSEFFTGNAYNYGLVPPDSVYKTVIGNVYFEPGARSNWHTHPSGQILIITDGEGYHQIEGEPIQELRKGSVVQCPPNTRHWHGASPDTGMHQLYILPNTERGIVDWMEAVTDEQYNGLKK